MRVKGVKSADIARGLKVSRQYVSHCISLDRRTGDFRRRDPYVQQGIANYLGLSFRELWDEPAPFAARRPDESMRKAG